MSCLLPPPLILLALLLLLLVLLLLVGLVARRRPHLAEEARISTDPWGQRPGSGSLTSSPRLLRLSSHLLLPSSFFFFCCCFLSALVMDMPPRSFSSSSSSDDEDEELLEESSSMQCPCWPIAAASFSISCCSMILDSGIPEPPAGCRLVDAAGGQRERGWLASRCCSLAHLAGGLVALERLGSRGPRK